MSNYTGPQKVRFIPFEEVRSYMDRGMQICTFQGYEGDGKYHDTHVIMCGTHDGEYIDLFDLQKWFDDNREWIDSLKVSSL